MLVSTIIPVHNRTEYLAEAVDSVLQQTYRPIEIVIVDDGSTDATGAAADDLARQHSDIIRVLHVENGGPGAAREHGRGVARGDYLQYLDSDDRLLPDKFDLQVTALRRSPDAGIAYGKTRLTDASGRVLRAPYKRTGESFEFLFPTLLVDRWWNTHTPLYRREVCDAVGPWSTARMSEDWEYDARCGALRTRLVFCDAYLSETRQHDTGRLTGGEMSREKLCDIARFLPVLYQSAKDAGVERGAPQMQHFSRWAFSMSRRLAAVNEVDLAAACLELAKRSDRKAGTGLEYRAFDFAKMVMGWKRVGRLSEFTETFRRGPGRSTMKQSWV